MSFGQKILEKYGFRKGNGLGKHENGIIEPIKATFKFDNSGLGDEGPVREDHWWERVFNEASNNVNVEKSQSGKIAVKLHDKDGVEITNKSFSLKKLKDSNTKLQYGSFLKSATLLANVGKEEEIEGHFSTNDIEIKPVQVLTDEELFKACGGRTAHKGARHGLKLSGKLQRIADQEKALLEKMKEKHLKHEVFREPLAKKQKQNPLAKLNSSKEETSDDSSLPIDTESDYVLKSKKRKKRDKKEELQLVTQINSIGLNEEEKQFFIAESEHPTEREEDESRDGTPMRKKKKAKRVYNKLSSIQEGDQSSEEIVLKKKKRKGKRKLDEDDEMNCSKIPSNEVLNSKRVKLNDSYEASSSDGVDIADKINHEQELKHSKKTKNKSKKSKKRHKKNLKTTILSLAENL
ncbi:CLUMA_CG009778, isoform A [Clunio marinus]|uniref:G patch domain-containing protein 4 n=1 Tax=Clunio marinus TaxID=568069 RepID=A0A1J1ID31_9DIPT|nr:CLUMA_CG009778, isoform A [Clunio marinus]